MLIAQLIGGTEVHGITDGVVIVNNEVLKTSYKELRQVCGNIALDAVDTTKSETSIKQQYVELIESLDMVKYPVYFVNDNYLAMAVSHSSYEINKQGKQLALRIDAY